MSNNPTVERTGEASKPQKIDESTMRVLRGKYFTVRHGRVKECNHLLDQINEPTFRNCQFCWFSFFSTHGELVQVTDKAVQEQGVAFLDKMRGRKYREMFFRFMSTMAKFKKEYDERIEREAARALENGVGDIQGSKTEVGENPGSDSGQAVRIDNLPAPGVVGEQADTAHIN